MESSNSVSAGRSLSSSVGACFEADMGLNCESERQSFECQNFVCISFWKVHSASYEAHLEWG